MACGYKKIIDCQSTRLSQSFLVPDCTDLFLITRYICFTSHYNYVNCTTLPATPTPPNTTTWNHGLPYTKPEALMPDSLLVSATKKISPINAGRKKWIISSKKAGTQIYGASIFYLNGNFFFATFVLSSVVRYSFFNTENNFQAIQTPRYYLIIFLSINGNTKGS